MPPHYTTTIRSGIHVPTSANDGSDLCLGLKQMADELDDAIAPIGAVHEWAGGGDPVGGKWAICDGRALSRADYAALFSAIRTTYGVGDGSATFNLPNVAGRTVVSPDPGSGGLTIPNSARALGQTGGEERHQLTIAELASHHHDLNPAGVYSYSIVSAPNQLFRQDASGGSFGGGMVTGDSGGGQPHNNMQPYIVLNRIIRIA